MLIKSEKFLFKNKDGEYLSGSLETPANPIGYAIFAHCFTCSKSFIASSHISKKLAQQGIATLRFDFTGLGNSQGDFSNTNFSSNISDLVYAFKALKEKYKAPSILIGHSLGGAAVLRAAEEIDDIKAVITIGAPSDVEHVSHLFKNDIEEINSNGLAQVNLAGREFTIKKQFIDDLKHNTILDLLAKSKKAHLIMHSPIDDTVSIDHASKIYSSLKHSRSFISLDNMNHLITNKDDASYIALMIGSWVGKYLTQKEMIETPKVNKGVLVSSVNGTRFTQNIHSSDHQIIADEPKSFKGDNLGMSPYELLLSSLGACTSMTIKMYAERKKIEIENVSVELDHYRDEDDSDHINKKITITADITDEQRQRMHEIAEKCPVNKTLSRSIKIHQV